MKRIAFFFVIMLVPLGFFLAAWQGYSWQQLKLEAARKDAIQKELLETNRQLLATLAQQESPSTVVPRAEADLGMTWPRQDQIRTLIIESGGGPDVP